MSCRVIDTLLECLLHFWITLEVIKDRLLGPKAILCQATILIVPLRRLKMQILNWPHIDILCDDYSGTFTFQMCLSFDWVKSETKLKVNVPKQVCLWPGFVVYYVNMFINPYRIFSWLLVSDRQRHENFNFGPSLLKS